MQERNIAVGIDDDMWRNLKARGEAPSMSPGDVARSLIEVGLTAKHLGDEIQELTARAVASSAHNKLMDTQLSTMDNRIGVVVQMVEGLGEAAGDMAQMVDKLEGEISNNIKVNRITNHSLDMLNERVDDIVKVPMKMFSSDIELTAAVENIKQRLDDMESAPSEHVWLQTLDRHEQQLNSLTNITRTLTNTLNALRAALRP